jgi:hypothetical protein
MVAKAKAVVQAHGWPLPTIAGCVTWKSDVMWDSRHCSAWPHIPHLLRTGCIRLSRLYMMTRMTFLWHHAAPTYKHKKWHRVQLNALQCGEKNALRWSCVATEAHLCRNHLPRNIADGARRTKPTVEKSKPHTKVRAVKRASNKSKPRSARGVPAGAARCRGCGAVAVQTRDFRCSACCAITARNHPPSLKGLPKDVRSCVDDC